MKGGTAKPAKGAVSPWVIPTLGDPAFSVPPASLHGFDDTGLLRVATVSGSDRATNLSSSPQVKHNAQLGRGNFGYPTELSCRARQGAHHHAAREVNQ